MVLPAKENTVTTKGLQIFSSCSTLASQKIQWICGKTGLAIESHMVRSQNQNSINEEEKELAEFLKESAAID